MRRHPWHGRPVPEYVHDRNALAGQSDESPEVGEDHFAQSSERTLGLVPGLIVSHETMLPLWFDTYRATVGSSVNRALIVAERAARLIVRNHFSFKNSIPWETVIQMVLYDLCKVKPFCRPDHDMRNNVYVRRLRGKLSCLGLDNAFAQLHPIAWSLGLDILFL